jgi:hypothetical protein
MPNRMICVSSSGALQRPPFKPSRASLLSWRPGMHYVYNEVISEAKLQQLIEHFGASKAKIIRQLVAQAEPADFPPSWQMRAAEHRVQQRGRSF